eukprot:2729594-Amphidinium_carterae.2
MVLLADLVVGCCQSKEVPAGAEDYVRTPCRSGPSRRFGHSMGKLCCPHQHGHGQTSEAGVQRGVREVTRILTGALEAIGRAKEFDHWRALQTGLGANAERWQPACS